MLNFNDLLKKNASTPDKSVGEDEALKPTLGLFYQTDNCREFISECVYIIENSKIVINKNTDDLIVEEISKSDLDIIVIEIKNCKDVVSEAKRISYLLPNKATIVIVGSENSITTIRELKEIGFYYIFWPIDKLELISFFQHVYSNRNNNMGVDRNRKAKRIIVLGAKGGVGATFISSELVNILTTKKNAKCLYVDHNFYNSNVDVMLRMKKFEPTDIKEGDTFSTIDSVLAKTLLIENNEHLSVLSLTSSDLIIDELIKFQSKVVDTLIHDFNFIIEDVSIKDVLSGKYKGYLSKSDCVLLVSTPGISELREVSKLRSKVDKLPGKRPRVIVVINHVQPEKFSALTRDEVVKFLKHTPEAIVSFENNANQYLLEETRVSQTKSAVSRELLNLTMQVLGEERPQNKSLLMRLLGR